MRNRDEIFYFDVLEDFYWSSLTTAIAVGDPTDAMDTYGFTEIPNEPLNEGKSLYTIFDTGSSDILISTLYFKDLIERIFAKVNSKEWTFTNNDVLTKCYNNFPTLFFAISGKWIELRPSDYVADISLERDRSQCALKIKSITANYIVLGNPIFTDYYVIHDSERGRMGIAPHVLSSKRKIDFAETPYQLLRARTETIPQAEIPWAWIITGMIAIGLGLLFIFAILPELEKKFPGETCTHIGIGIGYTLGVVALGLFVIQPLIDTVFRKEAFRIFWLDDLLHPVEKALTVASD